jgi:hypothetical protein
MAAGSASGKPIQSGATGTRHDLSAEAIRRPSGLQAGALTAPEAAATAPRGVVAAACGGLGAESRERFSAARVISHETDNGATALNAAEAELRVQHALKR